MGVEAGVVSVTASLTVDQEPGLFIMPSGEHGIRIVFSGEAGVYAVGRLIEEAIALRAALEARI